MCGQVPLWERALSGVVQKHRCGLSCSNTPGIQTPPLVAPHLSPDPLLWLPRPGTWVPSTPAYALPQPPKRSAHGTPCRSLWPLVRAPSSPKPQVGTPTPLYSDLLTAARVSPHSRDRRLCPHCSPPFGVPISPDGKPVLPLLQVQLAALVTPLPWLPCAQASSVWYTVPAAGGSAPLRLCSNVASSQRPSLRANILVRQPLAPPSTCTDLSAA